MSTLVLLLFTGLGLGALYFLAASGLSLIYGLMGVLNFAHGAFLSLAALVGWEVAKIVGAGTWGGYFASVVAGIVVGTVFAALTELLLIRPLYNRHIEQVLVTVGLGLAGIALFEGIWGSTADFTLTSPLWMRSATTIAGANVPNVMFVNIIAAGLALAALAAFLRYTRYGLIIRAGVENRSMVTALGIDVRRSFTLMFAIGGAAAGLGGVLASHFYQYTSAHMGQTLLIFAFIVTVIGGMGSLTGAAIAAVIVGVLQQYANRYWGVGDLVVVLLLAAVLLVRPAGLMGRRTA